MHIRDAEAIVRELIFTNLVRVFCGLRPLVVCRCGVGRTAVQIYRSLKKKRAHRQFRTMRRWRKRKKISIRECFWQSKSVKDTLNQLMSLTMVLQGHTQTDLKKPH